MFQSHENGIEGVTSIAVINEGANLLLTLGENDALYLLSIGNSETQQKIKSDLKRLGLVKV